ncbi:MAG: hypothetical protein WC145_03250 [Aliarcobacter sp.]|nr:hypothetical protein [Candidatus Methanomethylophilaceae archaeon]
MPTRANAIGRYDGLAPELQDTLRRNGMQARLVQRDGDVLLAVQGHDSPLLTYPLSQSHLKALTDGGTNSSNRKAYDAFAAVVGADFHLPKDYVHARNANGRVTMGLHGYRIGEGEYGRTVSPFVDLWARRSMLGWTPRQQEGYHLRRLGGELRYGGAPLVADRPDGRMKPGELLSGGYGFYYKGGQAARQARATATGEDVLQELRTVVPEIQPRPSTGETARPYSELITSDVYFSREKWDEVLSSHGIVVDERAGTLTVKSTAINRDLVYDLRADEMAVLTSGSLKDIPVQERLDVINGVIGKDYEGAVSKEMLESREPVGLALSPAALEEIREQERSIHPQPVIAQDLSYVVMQQAVLQEREDERRGIGRVWGESLYDMQSREGWFREGQHGREVSVGDIRVEPVQDEAQKEGRDMKYRMTAVINGEEVSHEITRRQYDKFMAVDDYHRMKLFSKVFDEVDMKQLPREQREGGAGIGAAILAALTVAGEMARGPRMAPDLYLERHAGGRVYMKPGVDSPQDIASRAFEAGINAAEHGVGLGR